jgi:hypothetical protein
MLFIFACLGFVDLITPPEHVETASAPFQPVPQRARTPDFIFLLPPNPEWKHVDISEPPAGGIVIEK